MVEFQRKEIDAEHFARDGVVAFAEIREVTDARNAAVGRVDFDAESECRRAVVRDLNGADADGFLDGEGLAAVGSDQVQAVELFEASEIFEAFGVVFMAEEFDIVLGAEFQAGAFEMIGVEMGQDDGVEGVPGDAGAGQARLQFLG